MPLGIVEQLSILDVYRDLSYASGPIRLHACSFIKKKLQHRCFPVNIAKFKNSFFYKISPVTASVIPDKMLRKLFVESS